MKIVRLSSLLIGISMITQWIFFIVTGNVPELKSAPISISFHIAVEFITATVLILTFVLLKRLNRWKSYIAVYGQGMLGYTAINSSGYFAQTGSWSFLFMFGVVLFFSICNTLIIIKDSAVMHEEVQKNAER